MTEQKEGKECGCPYCEVEGHAPDSELCAPCEIVIVECVHCGQPVRDGAEVCPHCGKPPK
ncbi:MAG: zinc-ribbon domain-containing protein [Actinobacteria bacterium]|nr:zinc-ribbon domain-containing protein [Actinomycetota bacterium]MBU2688168.1 zinc-ribbon domain-containing protein [Actinomycetota bacterium]